MKNEELTENLKEFIKKYEDEQSAPIVQGIFSDGASKKNNILYSKSYPVTLSQKDSLEKFEKILMKTMLYESGMGIASCQVGVPLQLFIIGTGDVGKNERYNVEDQVPYQTFVNPRIVKVSKANRSFWHGCLSARGQKMGQVATYDWVKCEAYTLSLKSLRLN